jgi:MFS transporter, ACS family, hexuronate transporter
VEKVFPTYRDVNSPRRRRVVVGLRWWIAAILFASTVINYTDRQTLSLLAPFLKQKYRWTNTDYASILVAFRIAYSVGQTVCGRLMDKLGTKRGLSLTVLWYSIASMLTPLARGLSGFIGVRFLLGAGESGNWPGATKAVSEWFPDNERAFATSFFDSGSSIGAALAPLVVLPLYFRWGMNAAFVLPGLLGLFWLVIWRRCYYLPQDHPRITTAELEMIVADRDRQKPATKSTVRWRELLKLPQTWGAIISRASTDPVFFFIAEWFPIYLVAKGIPLRNAIFALWIPFVGTDAGNLLGGLVSGTLIKRGYSVEKARKIVIIIGAVGIMLLIPTIFTVNLYVLTALFAAACFSYGLYTTIANVLPSDLFFPESVASVSGVSGTAAGLCTIVVFELAGRLSDARLATGTHVFDPLIVLAGLVPLLGMVFVLFLVRNTRATEQGLVRRI